MLAKSKLPGRRRVTAAHHRRHVAAAALSKKLVQECQLGPSNDLRCKKLPANPNPNSDTAAAGNVRVAVG